MDEEKLKAYIKSLEKFAEAQVKLSEQISEKISVLNWRLFSLEQSLPPEVGNNYLDILQASYSIVSSDFEA